MGRGEGDRSKSENDSGGNDSGALSINNLRLLYFVAKIDSNNSPEGLSAGKFSLKSKQFFLLS